MNFFNRSAYFEMVTGNFNKAVELAQKSYSIDSNNKESLRVLGLSYLFKRQYQESSFYFIKFIEILNNLGEFQTGSMVPIGYAFLRNG